MMLDDVSVGSVAFVCSSWIIIVCCRQIDLSSVGRNNEDQRG